MSRPISAPIAGAVYLPDRLGHLEPTDSDVGVKAIPDIYEEHGYLGLKHFLPRTDVISFRGWVFSHLADTGLIEPGSDPTLGNRIRGRAGQEAC